MPTTAFLLYCNGQRQSSQQTAGAFVLKGRLGLKHITIVVVVVLFKGGGEREREREISFVFHGFSHRARLSLAGNITRTYEHRSVGSCGTAI